jgi:hypothetical protein
MTMCGRSSPWGAAFFVGGDFKTIGAVRRPGLAALSAVDGAVVLPWNPVLPEGSERVADLLLVRSRLYAGVNAADEGLAALDPETGATVKTWRVELVHDMAADDTSLFISGHFEEIDGVKRAGFAAIDLTTNAVSQKWTPDTKSDSGQGIAVSGEVVFVSAHNYDAQTNDLAALEAATGIRLPWRPSLGTWDPDLFFSDESELLAAAGQLIVGRPSGITAFQLPS